MRKMRNLSHITKIVASSVLAVFLTACTTSELEPTVNAKPNIVIFYVDDLGFGDIGVNGAKGLWL